MIEYIDKKEESNIDSILEYIHSLREKLFELVFSLRLIKNEIFYNNDIKLRNDNLKNIYFCRNRNIKNIFNKGFDTKEFLIKIPLIKDVEFISDEIFEISKSKN